MTSAFFMCLVVAVATAVAGHTSHMGRSCPSIDAHPNLDVDRISGRWFMVYKFDTSNTCVVWNITAHHDETLSLTESRQLGLLDRVSVDHTHRLTATLDIANPEVPGRMRIRWPTSLTGKADFVVFSTDYDNYMAVFECDRAGFFHRRSVAILGRTDAIEQRHIDTVKQLLDAAHIPHGALVKVGQETCSQNSRFNWHIDGELFGLLGPNRPADQQHQPTVQQIPIDDGFNL